MCIFKLKKLDYLYRSRQGQYVRFIKRYSQILELNIPMEPKSKKSISEIDKQQFQHHVNKQMTELNRRAFRGPVIMKINFYSAGNNPPHIHTLTKNYLDLLSTPLDKNRIKRKNLLFKDDRQVEVLIVNYHIEERHNKSSIQIKIMRYSNFVEDLKLIKQIQWNDFDCEARNPNFGMDELLERHSDKMLINWEQSLETYYDMKDFYKKHGEKGGRKNSEDIHLYHAQRSFLTEINFNIVNLVDLYFNETLEFPECSSLLKFDYRKHWFSLGGRSGISGINTQELPTQRGETKKFKNEIDKVLQKLSRNFTFMSPLLINLSLLILYIPPKNIKKDVDLDNLARRIVPQINQQLQPAGKCFFRDNDTQEYTPKSVTQYQVIRIPRQQNDPIKGAVRIMLYPKSPFRDIWNDAHSLIFDWNDMLDR